VGQQIHHLLLFLLLLLFLYLLFPLPSALPVLHLPILALHVLHQHFLLWVHLLAFEEMGVGQGQGRID